MRTNCEVVIIIRIATKHVFPRKHLKLIGVVLSTITKLSLSFTTNIVY